MVRLSSVLLLLMFALAACAAPPAPLPLPAPAETVPAPEAAAAADDAAALGVTLPMTQPLASLVILAAGVITTTQTLENGEETVMELPVQGAFALPVWAANGDHRHPLAVILPDAGRVCEANVAEEWPCPTGLQRAPYPGLRYLAQGLALRGYMPLIVNLNGAYTPALDPDRQIERGRLIVERLLAWMADEQRQPPAETYAGELNQSVDYSKIILVGRGRAAEIALAAVERRMGQGGTAVGLLLAAPELPAGAALPDLATSVVLAGCQDNQTATGVVEAARGKAGRRSLLASVILDSATAGGFDGAAAAAPCATGEPLDPSQQQAWLTAYAADFADAAAGYAPPYPTAGLDVLAPMPELIHGLPVEASVTDPGRPVQPGRIAPFNLGEIAVEQPVLPPANRVPLRVEGNFILPEGEGPHPLVLWLHLRAFYCFGSDIFDIVWPCAPAAIPRYEMGYDYLLEALAGRGYAVIAPNLVGAFSPAPAWAPPDDHSLANSMDLYRVEPLVARLLDEPRRAPAWVAALKTGEHYGFVTVLRGPEHNPSGTFCQDRTAHLDADAARAFLAGLAPDFLDVALGQQPAAAIPGFDPAEPLPAELYGAPIEITALDPARRRLVLLPAGEAELDANRLGGAVMASGRAAISFCEGTGEQMCVVDQAVELRPNAPPEDWAFHQPKFAGYPPQLRVQWDAPDGRLRLGVPAEHGDLSSYATLHMRVLVDMFDPRNAELDSQALRVALVDAAANEASVILPPSEPALIRDRGERNSLWQWSQFPLRARSLRIPLNAFQGVDLSSIRSLDLVFDQTAQGSLLVSMVEFVAAGE